MIEDIAIHRATSKKSGMEFVVAIIEVGDLSLKGWLRSKSFFKSAAIQDSVVGKRISIE